MIFPIHHAHSNASAVLLADPPDQRESPSILEPGGLEPLNNQCHIQEDGVKNSFLSSTKAICHDEGGSTHVSSQHNTLNNGSRTDANLSD